MTVRMKINGRAYESYYFLIVCLLVNLPLSILAIRHTIKYYKQKEWGIDNDVIIMFIEELFMGFAGYISTLCIFRLKDDDWKITKWFNKKIKKMEK